MLRKGRNLSNITDKRKKKTKNLNTLREKTREAVDQTGVHHEVHAAMTHLTAYFAVLLDDRVCVARHQSVIFGLRQESVARKIVDGRCYSACLELRLVECDVWFGIFGGVTFGAGQFEKKSGQLYEKTNKRKRTGKN